jgi:thiamine kinase-like enzyme
MTNNNMDLTTSIHRYLTTAPTSHFLGQTVDMVDHWAGHDNLLWLAHCRGQEAVIKLYLDAGQARGRRQFDGQERFAPSGIAPQPLWFDRYPAGLSRQVLVYQWVEGAHLAPDDPAASMALAQGVALLHSGDPAEVRRFCPHPLNLDIYWRVLRAGLPAVQSGLARQSVELQSLFARLAAAAERLVAASLPLWTQVPPTPVHGDLRPENLIDLAGRAMLLDWEMFGLGDPALDVASLLFYCGADLPADQQRLWMRHYLEHFDQSGLAQRIEVYLRLLPFHSLVFLLSGLHMHLDQADERTQIAEVRGFLADAINRSLVHASKALGLALDEMPEVMIPNPGR